MLANCDIWTVVDFGNGPVEIRCTEVGEHSQHRCEVNIIVEPDATEPPETLSWRNVFEDKAN